jgi:putative flippase GtrA
MSLLNNKRERIRFLKFAFVGVTGAIVDFGIMNLLRLVLHVPLIWSQAISFFVAVINNFLWNRFWTYPDSRSKTLHRQLLQFFLINIVGIIVRTPLVTWFDKIILNYLDKKAVSLPWENFVISQNLALAGAVGIVLLWNFFANRYWTYSDVPKDDEESLNQESPHLRKE